MREGAVLALEEGPRDLLLLVGAEIPLLVTRGLTVIDKALEFIARLLLVPGLHESLETHKVLVHDADGLCKLGDSISQVLVLTLEQVYLTLLHILVL